MRSVKFDAIRIAEVTINLVEQQPSMTAKAAFVNTTSGHTHGWTNGRSWSEETLAKLRELKESMERDLEKQHFDDLSHTPGTTTSGSVTREGFHGLGEHLGTTTEPVPQG